MYIDNDLFESIDSGEAEVCGGYVGALFGAPLGANDRPWWYYGVPAATTNPFAGLPPLNPAMFWGSFSNPAANQAILSINGTLRGGGGPGLNALNAAAATFTGGARTVNPFRIF